MSLDDGAERRGEGLEACEVELHKTLKVCEAPVHIEQGRLELTFLQGLRKTWGTEAEGPLRGGLDAVSERGEGGSAPEVLLALMILFHR